MKRDKLVPKRRFKEFKSNEAWEQRKFEDIFVKLRNNNLSRAQLNYGQGIANNVHYGDILIKFGECLDVGKNQLPYINNDSLVDKYRSSFLMNGDIIFADAAEDEIVGKCTEIQGLTTQIVISGLHTIPCRPMQSFANSYLGYYLNSNAYHNQLLALMQGTKVSSISRSALDETYVVYPKSEEEQGQIGTLFSNLDKLITLHQRKLKKLKDTKLAYLSEMFPKEGEKYPKRRFASFTDPWELRKLSEFVEKAVDNRGKTPPIDINGTHPLIEVASLGAGSPDYSKLEKYLNDDVFKNNLRGYIKKGDILFSTVGSIGQVSLMDGCENAAIAQNIVAFRSREGYLEEFLYALLSTKSSKDKAYKIAMGAVQPSIKVSQLVDVKYLITKNEDEQNKIGTFFTNLDKLITLHQRKLEKLEDIKKAYLNEMFV